ncbi:MAG: DUF2865 domain-containing protein [Bradyrhizobium sp.]|nr:MAG: DUF2865 domain-containing protein [Bradyrhizobium sp.]
MAMGRRIVFALVALCAAASFSGAPVEASEFLLLPLTAPRLPAAHLVAPPVSTGRPVCVRLCDGYFFPLSSGSGPFASAQEEASCRALCPEASVAVYRLDGASDDIAEATSASGERYSALAAAFRYRAATSPACACRRAGEAGLDYWRDPSLRKGDAIMTAEGVVVFRGASGGGAYSDTDFARLDGSPIGALGRSRLSGLAPANVEPSTDEEGPPAGRGIEIAKRAASAAGEIRFLAAPSGGGG